MKITDSIFIPENELRFETTRSGGPGGQNVNKVSTAVQLRFNVANTQALPAEVRLRLLEIARNRISKDGDLMVRVDDSRSQMKNREIARERLKEMILRATIRPRVRRETRPSRSAKERRLQEKKFHAQRKKNRQKKWFADE